MECNVVVACSRVPAAYQYDPNGRRCVANYLNGYSRVNHRRGPWNCLPRTCFVSSSSLYIAINVAIATSEWVYFIPWQPYVMWCSLLRSLSGLAYTIILLFRCHAAVNWLSGSVCLCTTVCVLPVWRPRQAGWCVLVRSNSPEVLHKK